MKIEIIKNFSNHYYIYASFKTIKCIHDCDFIFHFNLDKNEYCKMLKKYNSLWKNSGAFNLEDSRDFVKEYLIRRIIL